MALEMFFSKDGTDGKSQDGHKPGQPMHSSYPRGSFFVFVTCYPQALPDPLRPPPPRTIWLCRGAFYGTSEQSGKAMRGSGAPGLLPGHVHYPGLQSPHLRPARALVITCPFLGQSCRFKGSELTLFSD